MYAYLAESKRIEGKPKSLILDYLDSIAAEDLKYKDKCKAFRKQVQVILATHELSKEVIARLEEALDKKVPLKNKTLTALTSNESEEWYTPPVYIDMARAVMGGIDLDPASNDLAQGWIQATKYYTAADDGLSQPWYGKVWLNPPYCYKAFVWTDKAIAEFEAGRLLEGIILVNQSGAGWHRRLDEKFMRCAVHKRIAFIDSQGNKQTSPPCYNSFFYLGSNTERFKTVFSRIGTVK